MVFSKQYRRLQCPPEMLSDGSVTLIKALVQAQVRILVLMMMSVAITGCSIFGDDEIDIDTQTGEQQMYRQAQRYLGSSNYDLAIASLQSLESRYPFGKFAEQAQLELSWSLFMPITARFKMRPRSRLRIGLSACTPPILMLTMRST